jgi:hypothetical protein
LTKELNSTKAREDMTSEMWCSMMYCASPKLCKVQSMAKDEEQFVELTEQPIRSFELKKL